MKPTKYEEGQLVRANFNLEDGRKLLGFLDNFTEGEGDTEHSYSLGNIYDGECYAVGEGDITEIVDLEAMIGKSYTFLGEGEQWGMVSGFDKMEEGVENKNPEDYKGLKCEVIEIISDGTIDDGITLLCKFKDGEEAVILLENLE